MGARKKLAGSGVDIRTIKAWFESSVKADVGRDRVEEDARMLANDPWTHDERVALKKRNQQPLSMNQIHQDYYLQLGRQIRNRMQPGARPRGAADGQVAKGLTDVMAYIMDANHWDFELTDAVADQLLVRGWLKVCYQKEDLRKEPIRIMALPWREMRLDPVSRRRDLADARFVGHERWWDLDEAIAQFPKSAQALRDAVSRQAQGVNPPGVSNEPRSGDPYRAAVQRGEAGSLDYTDVERQRVRLVEVWYRKTVQAWQLVFPDGRVLPYDEKDSRHVDALFPKPNPDGTPGTPAQLIQGPHAAFFYVIFCGETILAEGQSPYTHGMFPYVLVEAYRADVVKRSEDLAPNEPFGMIRLAKDPQKLYNSAMTKARFILSTRQVVMGKGVAQRDHVEQNAANPGGIIELDQPDGKFEFVDQLQHAQGLNMLLDRARDQMQASTGVNEATRGEGPEQSGRAMLARQQQSEMSNTYLVDNQRFAIQQVGRMLVSMVQQSYRAEKIVRITEDAGDRVIAINVTDPQRAQQLRDRYRKEDGTEGISVYGDVSQGVYDVTVDEISATQSRRETDNELMMALLSKLPEQFVVNCADLLVENMDLSNKAAFLDRIKKMQQAGQQHGPPPPRVQDVIKIDLDQLTPNERAQVLGGMGVRPDPQGPPPEGEAATGGPAPAAPPQMDPNKMAELAQRERESQRAHQVRTAETQIKAAATVHNAGLAAKEAHDGHQVKLLQVLQQSNRDKQAAKAATQRPSPSKAGGSSQEPRT